jgi:5-methylcytosine-specific restriction endonuclease McrA
MLRPCLGMPGQPCNQLGPGARCAVHSRAWVALRNADRTTAKATRLASPQCVVCGSIEDLTADHVVPLIRSGKHTGQRQTMCRACNRAKGIS